MSTTDTERPCDRYCTRECTLCRGRADLRELRSAADAAVRDTERDERLREAREAATRARAQNPPLGIEKWLITLDEEVTRLDAVVTAVREVHQPEAWDDDLAGTSGVTCSTCVDGNEDPVAYPCPTVRALDGGAS